MDGCLFFVRCRGPRRFAYSLGALHACARFVRRSTGQKSTYLAAGFLQADARRNLAHDLAAALGDQACGALIARMDPHPGHRNAQAVAQADQEIDVGDTPDPPREGAAQLEAPEIDHRLSLANLREAAGMLVVEWRHRAA